MKHRAKNKLQLVIQAQPLTRSGLRQKTECKRIALRSQNSFNIEADSAIRDQRKRGSLFDSRVSAGLVRRCYGVALGSAAGASSDDSDLDLLLSLFFELPVSLVPSSGEAVALLSP
jgi:hypothetical protein